MKIETTIVDAYLRAEDVTAFSNLWLYTDRTEHGIENVFHLPPKAADKHTVISQIRAEIISHASSFVPCNVPVWDALFENWRQFLDDTVLDLIVGYPDTGDAIVKPAPDGTNHMIFDLLCWEKYLDLMPLSAIAQNLLTHELFHVMVGKAFPDIEATEACGTYMDALDAITFNEGFAHLVSYNRQEIDTVLWDAEPLSNVYQRSVSMMRKALQETSPEQQKQFLYKASCGNYYDKYAGMCGMIYLGQQWQAGGLVRLKALFRHGYHGFAAQSAGSPAQMRNGVQNLRMATLD